MLNISTALKDALGAEVTTLAMCWKLTRKDSVVLGFTEYDQNLVIDGLTCKAAAGVSATAITSSLGVKVGNLEIEGMLSDEAIAEADILAGLYDDAQIDVWLVDYTNLALGKLHLKTGWLGQIRIENGVFVAEVRGLSAALQRTLGEVYTPHCRARFGDARCQFSLSSVTHSGTFTAIENSLILKDSARTQSSGYFDYGTLRMTSGANNGQLREISAYEVGKFTLREPFGFAVALGDSYVAIAGCDKRFETCASRFANALNFRGEPHVPGTDRIFTTASTR